MVKIYSTPNCKYCVKAKQFFNDHNIPFDEIDATKPENKQVMVELSQQMGVPVIVVGDKVVIGFNKKALDELLP